MSQQSWPPANLSHNAKDNKALQRHICLFRESSRTMTSQGRSENSDQSGPLHPMLPNADRKTTVRRGHFECREGPGDEVFNDELEQNGGRY